ncbi:MAG: NADH-quinone oxidoreductase subunit NuoF [Planctomycetes bacterium]|nr:NADH-quinone oxidoreductase subunit NuoF [Planctomycetota bacterium]
MAYEPVLTRFFGGFEAQDLDHALAHGVYEGARKALAMDPAQVIETVKASGLRGRGGAGFPCGAKWGFIPKTDRPRYLLVNADESEPGTFKDRALIERDPHTLLEGTIVAAHAIGCETAYIYIRGEFAYGARVLERAIQQARARGLLGEGIFGQRGRRLEVHVHRGAGAYICGEETGLISSLEGDRGYPKLKPPFPAVEGAWRCPTIVNNVETLCNVPWVFTRGVAWYRSMGTEKSPGPKVYGLSGHVNRPGLYEGPLGLPLKELIYSDEFGGGVPGGRALKAAIPGGVSMPVLTPAEVERCRMDFESPREFDSLLGTAGVICMDETVCMVDALWNILRFFHHESCGQCTPCREGTGWIEKLVSRIEGGEGAEGDLDTLLAVAEGMCGRTICVLADAAAWPVYKGFVKKYRPEFEDHVRERRCTVRGRGA